MTDNSTNPLSVRHRPLDRGNKFGEKRNKLIKHLNEQVRVILTGEGGGEWGRNGEGWGEMGTEWCGEVSSADLVCLCEV